MNSIQFTKTRTRKDTVLSLSFIIVGIVIMAVSPKIFTNLTGAMTSGLVITVLGLIFARTLKNGYRNPETGGLYKRKTFYFRREHKDEILSALKAGEPEKIKLEPCEQSNLKLDLYFSTSENRAYIFLSEYVPYSYVPCSEQLPFDLQKVQHLIG